MHGTDQTSRLRSWLAIGRRDSAGWVACQHTAARALHVIAHCLEQ